MLVKDKMLILSNWMLMLYVFSIVVFDEGSTILKIVRIIFLASCIAKIIIEKRVFLHTYIIWGTAFTAFCFLSILWALSREVAINQCLTLLYNIVCSFCLINFISNDFNRINFIIKTIFFAAISLFIRVTLQYGFLIFLESRGGIDMISANTVGMISAIAAVFGFYIIQNGLWEYKFPYYLGLIFNLVIVILSASRKAVFYVIIPLLFYFTFKSTHYLKIIRNIFLSLIAIAILYLIITKVDILYQVIGNRIESMIFGFLGIGETDGSTSLRLDMIKWGFNWFRSKILLGYGINNYSVLLGSMGTTYGSSGVYAHNNFIELMVDVGIIGTFIFYSLYLDVLVSGIKRLFKMELNQLMLFGLFIALVINEFGTVSYYSKFLQLVMLLIWLTIKKYDILNEEQCEK